ncbi:hypothetical protein HY416_00815 [Candidatus Kaiserbacteria bacterium]|nr:hypothetical protein [Candidatus Kaiserbacteria bacterium]
MRRVHFITLVASFLLTLFEPTLLVLFIPHGVFNYRELAWFFGIGSIFSKTFSEGINADIIVVFFIFLLQWTLTYFVLRVLVTAIKKVRASVY